jgi:outer membrane protein assembly factor BamB
MRLPRLLTAAAICAAAALTGLSGCSIFKDNRGPVIIAPVATDLPGLQSVGLHQVWQRQVPLEPGERIKKTWRLGLSIWIATTESRIIRIDAKSGVLKWSNGLGRENFDIYKPIELKGADGFPNGQVLVVTRGEAFIFSMETGDILRQGRLNMSVSADPVLIGNTLCVGGADTFYGLYMDVLGMKHWRVPAPGDLFLSAPVAMDNNVLIGSRNGHLWRISADNGDWDWKDRKTNGNIVGGLVADYNAVYVPCEDQRVYAFRTDTGGEIWEQQLEGRLEETPVLAGPDVLVTSVNRTMYALSRQSGQVKWKTENIAQVATINDDTVWVGDTTGVIRQLSLETGEEKAAALTNGIQLFVRNNVDQKVILVTNAGLVGMYSPSAVNER